MTFVSKSANPFYVKSKDKKSRKQILRETIEVKDKNEIYILGEMDEGFNSYGKMLGFKVLENDKTQFQLFRSKCLVYHEVTARIFMQKMKSFNFALSYGIPIVWIHSYVVPINWMGQFDGIFVGEHSDAEIWRLICELV